MRRRCAAALAPLFHLRAKRRRLAHGRNRGIGRRRCGLRGLGHGLIPGRRRRNRSAGLRRETPLRRGSALRRRDGRRRGNALRKPRLQRLDARRQALERQIALGPHHTRKRNLE